MLIHPHPDPVAFTLFGSYSVHWYGIMYLAGAIIAMLMGSRLIRHQSFSSLRGILMEDLIAACLLGVLIGGRLGYIIFYNLGYYTENPVAILRIWEGGMSFHGGLIGVIVALWLVAKEHSIIDWAETREEEQIEAVTSHRNIFLRLVDFAAVITPPGLALGRLGNFINAELPGRVADANLPWAMSFGDPDYLPRHPSQLYQLAVEGILLGVIMLWLVRRPRRPGWLAGMFLVFYGIGRFFVEFFREPDGHLGLLFLDLSMGQWLTIPMILVGFVVAYHEPLLSAWQRRQEVSSGGFWHDVLFSEPGAGWDERERIFAEEYGADDEPASRFGDIIDYILGVERQEETEEELGRMRSRLTRRQKRRLKKKKRRR